MGWAGPVVSYLLQGMRATALLCVTSVGASLCAGVILGTLSTVRVAPVRLAVRLYVEVWRGLPTVVTLFFVFFLLPVLHVYLGAFAAAILGLTLWGSANIAEIVRGAVQSIPYVQHTAARALGMNGFHVLTLVVLPQAIRRMLPPLVSFLAHAIQNTTLAAVIGVLELLESGSRSIQRLTYDLGQPHAVPIYAAVLAFFFLVCFPLTRLAGRFERRLVV